MARRVCNGPPGERCPVAAIIDQGRSRCPDCARRGDKARGTPTQRGYGVEHRKRFREGVLAKHPICQVCKRTPSTVADHYPLSKRELIDAGMDSNDPQHGRGLCHTCHSVETAQHQPGGFRISPRD